MMLQALSKDVSLSDWSMPLTGWQKSSCTGIARHVESLLAHPLCRLCHLASVQTWQTRSESPRRVLGWCFSPTHNSCLLEQWQAWYHALPICCGFRVVLWWKVPVLQARMARTGVAPWWKELCLFGMGVALGPQDGTNRQLVTLNLWHLQAICTLHVPLCFLPPPHV